MKRNNRRKESEKFLSSWKWTTLRYKVLQVHGKKCMCCGATPDDGETVICVDHIKPRHTHPHLSLEESNLQVLCHDCNKGKGAWDTTDYRNADPFYGEDPFPYMGVDVSSGGGYGVVAMVTQKQDWGWTEFIEVTPDQMPKLIADLTDMYNHWKEYYS